LAFDSSIYGITGFFCAFLMGAASLALALDSSKED
jgi:hypothetical protein